MTGNEGPARGRFGSWRPPGRVCDDGAMRSSILAMTIVFVAASGVADTAPSDRVSWSELEFKARKLFLSATAKVTARVVDRAAAVGELRSSSGDRQAVQPSGDRVAVVTTVTDMPFGREEVATAWIDHATGQALQAEKTVAGGGKYYWKLRRYVDDGYHRWRAEPEGRNERDAKAEAWSDRSERDYRWPSIPDDAAVTDPYALLYLISVARLDRDDARLDILLSSKDRVVELSFAAAGLVRRDEKWTETWETGSRPRSDAVVLRRVEGTASSVDGEVAGGDIDTGFFGMEGPLTIYVEPGTGMPVVVEGKASGIGHLEVRLERAVLCAAPPGE